MLDMQAPHHRPSTLVTYEQMSYGLFLFHQSTYLSICSTVSCLSHGEPSVVMVSLLLMVHKKDRVSTS